MVTRRPIEFDDHHPFDARKYWEVYEPSKLIRRTIIARGMARSAHELLHLECTAVPPLSYDSVSQVAKNMSFHYRDVFEGIDDFCFAVDIANQHEKIRPGEVQLNLLAVDALRSQIPFIRQGLRSDRTIV